MKVIVLLMMITVFAASPAFAADVVVIRTEHGDHICLHGDFGAKVAETFKQILGDGVRSVTANGITCVAGVTKEDVINISTLMSGKGDK